MKTPVNPSGNIEGIQVLRAIAALMVVMHHARLSVPHSEAWPGFGDTGVDIFFVISGFVMSYTTALAPSGQPMRERLAAIGTFVRKRAIRIVPLYWIALLWTARRELAHGQVGMDLAKDFFFIPHPNAVYHGWLAPTLQQGWTLNYEVFFYVLFACAMLCAAARTRVLLAALATLVVGGFVASRLGWPADPDSALGIARRFYGENIILEFGYGVILERLIRRAGTLPASRGAAWLVGAFAFACLAWFHNIWPRGVVEGLPAAVVVWMGIRACVGLRSKVLELLGAASYSIYLFHWASFGAVKPLAAALASTPDGPGKVALLIAAHFAVALTAGIAIHLLVEKPLLRFATRRFDGARKLPAAASA